MSVSTHSTDLQKLLKDCLGSHDASAVRGSLSVPLQASIRANRLEGLVYSSSNYEVPEEWTKVYKQRQRHGLHLLEVAHLFSKAMETAGIECLALRGPTDAQWLYGDVAARAYSDIDLYIPRKKVRAGWGCATTFGFALYHEHMPRGFYLRNHLNWALVHKEMDVMCDLHWAVDHPFQSIRIDYEGVFQRSVIRDLEGKRVRLPCSEDWLLLTGQHFLKHAPDLSSWLKLDDPLEQVTDRYLLKYVLDLSFFIKQAKELDWELLQARAQEWNIEEAFYCSVLFSTLLVEESIPPTLMAKARSFVREGQLPARSHKTGFFTAMLNNLSRKSGFNFDRINQLGDYCWPSSATHTGLLSRVTHGVITIPRLALAGIDTLLCLGYASIRKVLQKAHSKSQSSLKEAEVQHG